MTASDDAIRSTVEQYWACFSASDRPGWLGLFADDAWIEDPVGTPRHEGREAIGAFWDQSHELADSIELRGQTLNICAGEAAFLMEVRPVLGGQTMTMEAIDVMTFADDGRITSMRAFFDPSTLTPAAD